MLLIFLYIFCAFCLQVLISGICDVIRQGLNCKAAFQIAWFFAYGLPTLLYLICPAWVTERSTYTWMGQEQWATVAVVASVGYALFQLGYGFTGSRYQQPPTNGRMRAITETPVRYRFRVELLLLAICLGLLLLPIYITISQGILINLGHRSVHWRQIGLSIRLLYLLLPAVMLGVSIWVEKRSALTTLVLVLTVLMAVTAAVILAARMFFVLIPLIAVMTYSAKVSSKNRSAALYAALVILGLLVPAALGYTFRQEGNGNFGDSVRGVVLADLSRASALAYTLEKTNVVSSELIESPVLCSYLYWAILPIPRAYWSGKPFPANQQFSYYYRAEYGDIAAPVFLEETRGQTEIGFIEEALLNFGLLGMFVLCFVGVVACLVDRRSPRHYYGKVPWHLFIMLGTIYSFNGILNYLAPLIIVSFILHRSSREFRYRRDADQQSVAKSR